jgi:o-succinylbenzoate synthase
MSLELHWGTYRLYFRVPARTSRGALTHHDIYVVQLIDPQSGNMGWGEVAPLPGLSPDDPQVIEAWLSSHHEIESEDVLLSIPEQCPALLFGVEMALRDLQTHLPLTLFPGTFTAGKRGISINGLVWMSDVVTMEAQFQSKIDAGFTCLKMKIGALDITEELNLLARIRSRYSHRNLEIRVDANGAFSLETVFPVLDRLAELEIHSIEQPLPPGNWKDLKTVCAQSPIPVALDEECIGITDKAVQARLLDTVQPAFIILKPTLLGGFKAAERWISLAEARGIGWWVTSALESNLGLNAIAQWTASLHTTRFQGLGTGSLYTNNFSSPLFIQQGELWIDSETPWDEMQLQSVVQV